MSAVNNNNAVVDPWKEVVSHFRSLCFFRLQGNSVVSDTILRQILPRKIAEWSQSASNNPEEKKAKLEEMFQKEQRRIDDAWTLHELSAMQWREDLIPALSSQIRQDIQKTICEQFAQQNAPRPAAAQTVQPVQRFENVSPSHEARIAFDDIPGIIDLIVADERREAKRSPLRLN